MLRTWITVIALVTLIISGLLFLRLTYKYGHTAGSNEQRITVLEEKNKELGEAIKSQQDNILTADKFDADDELRSIKNDKIIMPGTIVSDVDGTTGTELELEPEFFNELSKLQ